MNFYTILHGKPNAGCHKATDGMEETFCKNLVDKFFQSMNDIKDNEVLIVDTRYWKDTWYSIYTYWVGRNILDTANRGSFLAISIAVPKQYFCLVSSVYDMFERAYKDAVIGTYISNQGKYLVEDFSDNSCFRNLCSVLEKNFANAIEYFDNGFIKNHDSANYKYYSLLDCDSKAFVEDLKKSGRIFVSGTYESKDSKLLKTDKYYRELQSNKSELLTKDGQIEQLSKRIKALEQQITTINASESNLLKTLKAQKIALEKENKGLKQSLSDLNLQLTNYKENERQIAKLLTANIATQSPHSGEHLSNGNVGKKVKDNLPIINTILLIIILLMSVFKEYYSTTPEISDFTDTSSFEEIKMENQQLKDLLAEKENQIKVLNNISTKEDYNDYSEDSQSEEAIIDEDCGLSFLQDGKFIDANQIDVTKKLIIKVSHKHNDYSFYTDNLRQRNIVDGESFSLERVNPKKSIIIVYRSNNQKKRNNNNVIIIK